MLFDFDKSTIKPEAAQILDRLVAFMNENKDKHGRTRGSYGQHRDGGLQYGAIESALDVG